MTAEGAIALTAAILAGSVALLGFGLDSAIEALASMIVIWRFTGTRRLSEHAEERAQLLVAISFFLLAPYIVQDAIRTLIADQHPHASWLGIGLAISSIIAMPLLGKAKHHIGRRLGSGATTGEGTQNLLCAYLAAGVLASLALNAALGLWWADPAVALAIAALAIKEGAKRGTGKAAAPRRRSTTNTSPDATTPAADDPHLDSERPRARPMRVLRPAGRPGRVQWALGPDAGHAPCQTGAIAKHDRLPAGGVRKSAPSEPATDGPCVAKQPRIRRRRRRHGLLLPDNLSYEVVIGRHDRFQLIGVLRLGEVRPANRRAWASGPRRRPLSL